MHFGIVTDENPQEHRIVMSPYGVEELICHGHQVTIEKGAGDRVRYSDAEFEQAGATIAYSKEEAWMRPDMLLRFRPPSAKEMKFTRSGQIFGGYIELPQITEPTRKAYSERKLSMLAFEEMVDEHGRWPLLAPLSLICGRMLPQIAARYLETFEGGRGKLLMGVPGVAPCNIVIIGAGMLGTTATRMFQRMGARVTVLDHDHHQLELLDRAAAGHVVTLKANHGNIRRSVHYADVLILAIHCPEGSCEKIITRAHLAQMQPRSLILDASITQGGAAETSRPTDLLNPTYIVDDIVHYCVQNITAAVARTASRAVVSALIPYLLSFASTNIIEAIKQHKEFDSGMICVDGEMRRKYDAITKTEE